MVTQAAAALALAAACHASGAAQEKVAYLTVDDGPSRAVTPRILGILARYDAKATFFVVGEMVEKNPSLLRRIVREGHAVGNHSYDHARAIYGSPAAFLSSLSRAAGAIRAAAGIESRLMRPPGFPTRRFTPAIAAAAREAGYVVCGWNVGTGDTAYRHADPRTLIENVRTMTGDGKLSRAVVLLHDTADKATTVDALPDIIDYLRRRGYRLAALTEADARALDRAHGRTGSGRRK